ncbi:MAG TPA: zinc ABC transporter substrate-binding protein, partial [Bacteroidales bacterium]|nr:zinc ABC transporter substrate-binding protein [Bacteroidales bacterium]
MSRLSFAAFVLLLMTASCSRPASEKGANTITVSILPEKYFVEKIAGDLLAVNVMIPPGASPVTWEPSPADMTRLGRS